MMSTAYADLGGGTPPPVSPVQNLTRHVHRFNASSGWCGCGQRDTGELAEGSIAWRAHRSGASA